MPVKFGGLNEYKQLNAVLMKRPQEAFINQYLIDAQWERNGFNKSVDFNRIADQHNNLAKTLKKSGVKVMYQPEQSATSLTSIFTRDACVVLGKGIVTGRLKPEFRRGEETDGQDHLFQLGGDIVGEIVEPGFLHAGDIVWIQEGVAAIGIGCNSNIEGVEQLKKLAGTEIQRVITVDISADLPSASGEEGRRIRTELSSRFSVINSTTVIAYKRALPSEFLDQLTELGFSNIIDVPENEYYNLAAEVLAVSPTHVLLPTNCPNTKNAIQQLGSIKITEVESDLFTALGGGFIALTRPYSRL